MGFTQMLGQLGFTGLTAPSSPNHNNPAGRMVLIALLSVISAVAFFLSLNLGQMSWIAWIAPIPVLWLAFGPMGWLLAFTLAWAAYALGSTNLLEAYAGYLPFPILMLAIGGPALMFAGSVMGARHVARRIGPTGGTLAFAVLWTAADYLMSLGRNGSISSPAYSQVGLPVLVQGASVFGIWIVTFILGFVSAGLAFGLRTRTALPVILAITLFAANASYGVWRIERAALVPLTRVGLGADDSLGYATFTDRAGVSLATIDTYVDAARQLAAQGATVIVFPEKLAILEQGWRDQAIARLGAAAHETQATIIIGFDDRGLHRLNEALIFAPDAAQPQAYLKRHFVPQLEDSFTAGTANLVTPEAIGVTVCKDMDYPTTLRDDQLLGHPTLLAVPAFDFDADRVFHARSAIMRGVEDGFAVARASKQGLLSISDATGRMIAMKSSSTNGMVTLVADVARGPGNTIYVRIGDVFAWACLGVSICLLGLGFRPRHANSVAPAAAFGNQP